MIFTFYKARGMGVGSSLVEDDSLELAKKLEARACPTACPACAQRSSHMDCCC